MKSLYFVSPHLDDAFFSCGGLMLQLLKKGHKITVINVFTKEGTNPQTLSAKAFLKQTQFADVETLYKQRVNEDKNVLRILGINVINLDKVEALWRKKPAMNAITKFLGNVIPELLHVYPTYRWNIMSGLISKDDAGLVNDISAAIKLISNDDKNVVVFAPVGIGSHVDHILVKKACEKTGLPLLYWSDLPYAYRKNTSENSVSSTMSSFAFSNIDLLKKKEKLAKKYVTQYESVFGETKLSKMTETIFTKSLDLKWLTI